IKNKAVGAVYRQRPCQPPEIKIGSRLPVPPSVGRIFAGKCEPVHKPAEIWNLRIAGDSLAALNARSAKKACPGTYREVDSRAFPLSLTICGMRLRGDHPQASSQSAMAIKAMAPQLCDRPRLLWPIACRTDRFRTPDGSGSEDCALA